MTDKKKPEPGVIHVKVTVTPKGDGTYTDEFDPKIITVTDYDTIINFRLVTPTPDDVVISSVSINPEDQDQLSNPSISKNGKQMTLSDVNTLKEKFNLTFHYCGKKSERLAMTKCDVGGEDDPSDTYPEIDNVPPR